MAATATQRGKSQSHLHRDFPSAVLKSWGNHRLLRCDAVDGNEQILAGKHRSALPRDDRRRLPPADGPEIAIGSGSEDSGLEKLREKLLGHLREVAGRMKLEVPRIDPSASGSPEAVRSSAAPAADSIPWNLRSKRAPRNEAAQAPSTDRTIRLRYKDAEKEQQKFSVSLTQEEIDEDVYALTGSRPRRRPKKRARVVQRQLDAIFPGLWLSDITPELYRVPE